MCFLYFHLKEITYCLFLFSRSRTHFVAHHTVRQRNRAGQSPRSVRRRWRTDDGWQPADGLCSACEGTRRCVCSQSHVCQDVNACVSRLIHFFQHVFNSCRAGQHRPTRSALLGNPQSAPVPSAVSHSGVRLGSQQVLRLLPQEKTHPAISASSGVDLYPTIYHYSLAMPSVNWRTSVWNLGMIDGREAFLLHPCCCFSYSCCCPEVNCSSALHTLHWSNVLSGSSHYT